MKLSLIILFISISLIGFSQKSDTALSSRRLPGLSYSVQSLKGDHYAKNLGFMCKKELQLQKVVKLPVVIRLGSLEYSNYLEGKGKLH